MEAVMEADAPIKRIIFLVLEPCMALRVHWLAAAKYLAAD